MDAGRAWPALVGSVESVERQFSKVLLHVLYQVLSGLTFQGCEWQTSLEDKDSVSLQDQSWSWSIIKYCVSTPQGSSAGPPTHGVDSISLGRSLYPSWGLGQKRWLGEAEKQWGKQWRRGAKAIMELMPLVVWGGNKVLCLWAKGFISRTSIHESTEGSRVSSQNRANP